MSTTSQRLREIMSIRDMKQADLIERTGINKGAMSCYLSGKYVPKQDNIYRLAKALNVNPAWLMGLDVPMEMPSLPIEELQKAGESVGNEIVEQAMMLYEAFSNATADVQQAVEILLKQFKPVADNMQKIANEIPHLETPKQENEVPYLKGMQPAHELSHLKKDKEE